MLIAPLSLDDWILAITTIAFIFSAFGNGANDVANSYATSVAAQTLTMPQVGVLATITEFVGAVGLGARVTSTIKNGIISIDRFEGNPGALMLAMGCAEVGSATWLMVATGLGMPVSTTQTVVGALIGVGFASSSSVKWAWESGSVSQVAASWAIAPLIAAGFSALIFATVKYSVLERRESFKWALRLIPYYLALTGAILALFIVIEAPTAPSLEEFGAGKAVGVILGVFFGVLAIAYVFFMPYFKRRLVMKDARVKAWHIPLGPLLLKDNPPLYFPGNAEGEYIGEYQAEGKAFSNTPDASPEIKGNSPLSLQEQSPDKVDHMLGDSSSVEAGLEHNQPRPRKRHIGPHERFLKPTENLSIANPQRLWGYVKFALLQGVTRDVVTHDTAAMRAMHARANKYDPRVEHLWTYCQVASAMMMSIAHGSNDVANAVGPWAAVYQTYQAGEVATRSPTPVWFLVIAGFLLGAGFWFYGEWLLSASFCRIPY